MKKGEIYEGIVEKIDFPNKGLVCVDGIRVIVKNAIPGQKIRFRIHKKRKDRCEGILLEVLENSPMEVCPPVCKNFPACGGCMYQTMDYGDQLSMKASQVKELLDGALKKCGQVDSQGGAEYIFEGICPSPLQWGYRNKMEFSFGDSYKDGPLALGLHKKASTYDILTTDDCKIVHSDFTKILKCVLDYFTLYPQPFYRKMQHEGYLRHLLVRRAQVTGEILVNLVTTSQVQPDLSGLADKLKKLPLEGRITGILHIINDSLADVVASDETRILFGNDYFYEEILGLKFKITPFSFFQTNSLGAEVLYSLARSYIGDTKDMTIFDLYSGTGTIAQILAPVARRVIGVEIVEEAVIAARENAALNHLDNCQFIAGDVLKVLDTIKEKPDFIVLDPPRDGIHPKALEKIIDYGVDRMVYISCKPTSLARDLEVLIARGYRVERVKCVDMFPGSVHVETVVLLGRELEKSREHVYLDYKPSKEIDLPGGATYSEIQQWVQAEYGLKVSSLYISQVKRKCGLDVGQNYNLSKKEDAKVPQCPPEKEAAIEAALKHFKMI